MNTRFAAENVEEYFRETGERTDDRVGEMADKKGEI